MLKRSNSLNKMKEKLADIMCYGEALWDIFPSGRQIGGAPLNVSYHLNKLNKKGCPVSRIGSDALGEELRKKVKDWGISTQFLQLDPVHPTGTVEAVVKENEEVEYEIKNTVAWDFIEWNPELKKGLDKAGGLVFGSLAMRNDISYKTLTELIPVAKYRIFDINIRLPFFNREKVQSVLGAVDLLKVNEHELKILAKWIGKKDVTEEKALSAISEEFGIFEILLTKGSKGAAYYQKDTGLTTGRSFKIRLVDPVGSGDAFLAAFLSARYFYSWNIQESLDFASALGAFVATKNGACPEYKIEDILSLLKKSNTPFMTN